MHHTTHSTAHEASNSGLERAGDLLRSQHPQLVISKQKLRQADAIQMVRQKRESDAQNLGFSSRPFVLCGLPVKRPSAGCILHERRNGRFVLQVTGHPSYGLPWGQDRLVPIFLATMAVRQKSARITFNSAAEMLDTFGIQQGGSQYRRLVSSFQRIFGATIFFGTDIQRDRAAVVHCARFNFMTEARIWYSRDLEQALLPGDCQNVIVLSPEFYQEISSHPIPTDLEAAKALSASPAALDLFTWLSYRCFTARGRERVPLFGEFGLVSQLGSAAYARPRKFREKLEGWLKLVRAMWPECPAQIDQDGAALVVDRSTAVLPTITTARAGNMHSAGNQSCDYSLRKIHARGCLRGADGAEEVRISELAENLRARQMGNHGENLGNRSSSADLRIRAGPARTCDAAMYGFVTVSTFFSVIETSCYQSRLTVQTTSINCSKAPTSRI